MISHVFITLVSKYRINISEHLNKMIEPYTGMDIFIYEVIKWRFFLGNYHIYVFFLTY